MGTVGREWWALAMTTVGMANLLHKGVGYYSTTLGCAYYTTVGWAYFTTVDWAYHITVD